LDDSGESCFLRLGEISILKTLMKEDTFLSECGRRNPRLLRFLERRSVVLALLALVTQPPVILPTPHPLYGFYL
jgi:hypothetical protein